MNLVFVAAFIVACGAAKLDRTYLPPLSSQDAGGAPGSLQTPFISTGINQDFLQTPFGRTSDSNPSQGNQLPSGSYENEHQGVVVEAAAPGTRASNQPSGLGGPRENYGSTDSKVGDAAFRDTKYQAGNANRGYQSQAQFISYQPQGPVNNQNKPDLSAFYKPPGQINAGYRPGNQNADQASNTVKYHMNIGLNKFNYGFETENGIKMEENGVSSDGVKTQGGYSYTGDDGKVYTVMYTADKDGYRPMGSHLPTPPPIPLEILESLQQNARDEANGIQDDGSYDAQKYNAEDDYTQSVANGNYYDRQSNFENPRPESNAGASAVISQDQQGFVRPNSQGQFSSYNFSKDTSSTQTDSSKFGTGVTESDNTPNKGNILAQNGQTTQFNNRFGAQFQFIPPYPGYFQKENPALEIDSSKVGFNNNFNNAQPHSEQKYQHNESPGKPISTLTELNSYGTSSGYETSNNQQTPSRQISHSFDNSPQNDGTLSQTTSIPNTVGITSAQNSVINSYQNQESFSQIYVQSTGDSKIENTNPDLINRFSHTSSLQTLPTKIPELTLTTPLEHQVQTTNSESSELGTSFIDFQPQNPNSVNFVNSQSNLQIPSAGQFSNTFTIKPVGSDNSNYYNKPPNHFNTPSTHSDSNKTPDISSSPVNSGTQPLGSLFPNTPEVPVFSTQYQSVTGSTKYPQTSLAPNAPTLATKEDETENNTYQTNGITQATISSFPSITTTYSSPTSSGEVYEYNKPVQGLPISSQEENTGESNSKINQQTFSQNEDNIIPKVSIESIKQFDQSFSTSNISSSGQQTTPSRFGVQTSSTLEQKSSQSQFGTQGTSSFGQIPTLSPFGAQTSSLFGQNSTQQQFASPTSFSFGQQNTPSQLSAQISSPFDQKQTDFIGYTSFSLNQQTPTRFNIQTSPPFGQKPNQPQPSVSFGQGTIPSRFGVQTSSSFGQKPAISPFGAQTSSAFGQKNTPPQTNFSFGQQSTLSRFGIESTLGEKPSQPQRGEQISYISSSGSQPTPSRFGIQSGSLFEQNPNLPTFSTSLNQQTIPTRFDSQTSSLFGQQTIPSRFDIQAASFFGQKPTQPQRGGQTNFSFSNATPSGFGTQTSSAFGQQTTPSRFGIQSSSSSGQETTLSPFGGQKSTLFGQKITPSQLSAQTGSSFGQQTTLSTFGVQSSATTGQQAKPLPFGVQTSSIFGQTSPSQFENSLSEQQTKLQFGVDVKQEQQSQFQESNKQSENQSNSKTTTLRPSNSQNSQVSVENTNPDGSYQYNKPTTGFLFNEGNEAQTNFGLQQSQINSQLGQQSISSQQENKFGQQIPVQSDKQVGSQLSQFVTKPNNQFGVQTQSASAEKEFPLSQQTQLGTQFGELLSTQSDEGSFSSTSQSGDAGKQNQHSQVELFPRFPEQSKVTNKPFEFLQPTTSQFDAQTSTSGQSFDNKGRTTSKFSSTSTDNTQYQTTSTFSNSQSSFNLQKQEQSQSSQSGEVYQYNKPAQSLPDSSREESNRFEEDTQQEQIFGKHDQNKLDTTKPITSHLSQSNEKLDNNQLTTQSSDASQTETNSKPQTAFLGILPSSHPFPHLAFYSACCRGSKPQNSQGSQSLSDKVPSNTHLISNLGSNTSSFNKNDKQDTNGSRPVENKFDIQGKEPASNRFGEDTQQGQITGHDQSKFDTTKPITSHLSQSNEKLDDDQSSMQSSDASQTQTDSMPQTASLGTLPSSQTFPHLSFYSACCGNPKPQNGQGSQSLSDKNTPLIGNSGSNTSSFNKNDKQLTNGNGSIENKFGIQGKEPAGSNDFGVQKDTHNVTGKGEEFGGPREPPKFDETGYHY